MPVPERIHLNWIILLLLLMLSLFWKTTLLLDVEDWQFLDFLYMILGPILVFFAASVVGVPAPDGGSTGEHAHYFGLSGRFFLMLALQQAWLIGVDLTYDSVGPPTALNGIMLTVFGVLSISRSFGLHVAGSILAWIGFAGLLGFQAAA